MRQDANRKPNTAALLRIALFVAILSVTSFFVIPVPLSPVVLSLHTVMVNVIGLLLSPAEAFYTILLYLCMGLLGLPVFSGGTGGADKLFSPAGGFYFGFLFAAFLISLLKGRHNTFSRNLLITLFVGMPVQHLFAVLFFCFYNGFHVLSAFLTVSLPFLPGDILKCFLSSAIGTKLRKIQQNM